VRSRILWGRKSENNAGISNPEDAEVGVGEKGQKDTVKAEFGLGFDLSLKNRFSGWYHPETPLPIGP
jgi:hypothetical protein